MQLIEDILEKVMESLPELEVDSDTFSGFHTEEFEFQLREKLTVMFNDRRLYSPLPS